jgi:hypothetical protein
MAKKVTKINLLPAHLRAELDRRIIESGYGDYRGHSEWLKGEGHEISNVTICDHGTKIRDRIQELADAKNFAIAYGISVGEDELAVPRMINGMVQDALFKVASRIHKTASNLPDDDDGAIWSLLKQLNMLTKSLADTSRSDVMVSKYSQELKDKQAAKLAELTAEGQELGINTEYLKRLESEWLGLFEAK